MEIIDNKMYIVSLGDTKKYRVSGRDLKQYSKELKEYLSSQFADDALTYYDSANVEEGDAAAYPELTHVEFEKVKTDLKRQIEVRDADQQLDSDAPYSDVDKSAI